MVVRWSAREQMGICMALKLVWSVMSPLAGNALSHCPVAPSDGSSKYTEGTVPLSELHCNLHCNTERHVHKKHKACNKMNETNDA